MRTRDKFLTDRAYSYLDPCVPSIIILAVSNSLAARKAKLMGSVLPLFYKT